jgi:alcohol dehydrogenase class IV
MDIDVSKASKERVKKLLIERLYEINGKLGIRMDYKDCKVSKDRISILSTSAMNDCCMVTNPRVPKLEEVEAIYEKIL